MHDTTRCPRHGARTRSPRRARPGTVAAGGVIAVGLVLGGLTACSADADDDSAATFEEQAERTVADAPASDDASAGGSSVGSAGGGLAETGGFDLDAIGRDLAIELRVSMTTEDLRGAVDGIRRAAAASGGGVVSSDVDYGRHASDDGDDAVTGRATLVVKVPPAALDSLLGGLDELGVVTSLQQDAEDVTDRLVDLDVRTRNQRESVERIRELLSGATDLEQIVRLESEMTARQVELERLEAVQQELEARVALSTLTIDIVPETGDVSSTATDEGIGDAFRDGWEAFLTVLFGIALVLAVLTPFIAVVAVAGAIAWMLVRGRGRTPIAEPLPVGESDVSAAQQPDERVGASRRE
jgi:hypothetical protein